MGHAPGPDAEPSLLGPPDQPSLFDLLDDEQLPPEEVLDPETLELLDDDASEYLEASE